MINRSHFVFEKKRLFQFAQLLKWNQFDECSLDGLLELFTDITNVICNEIILSSQTKQTICLPEHPDFSSIVLVDRWIARTYLH